MAATTCPASVAIISFRIRSPISIKAAWGEAMALAVDKQPAAQNFDCQFRKNLITGKSRCIESDFLVTIAGVFHVGNRTNRTSCPEIVGVWLGTGIESGFGFGNRSQGQGQLGGIALAVHVATLGNGKLWSQVESQGQLVLDGGLCAHLKIDALESCLDNDTFLVHIAQGSTEVALLVA